MELTLPLERRGKDAGSTSSADQKPMRVADDKAMLRAAANLTRDINRPRPEIYWPDMLISAGIGYAALYFAITASATGWAIVAAVVAVLALYRALLFIHELTHIKQAALPGFRFGWHAVVGVPLLTPSFMYEGVHSLHHSKIRYGTAEDPEYLPLALMKPWTLPMFVLVSLLAPLGLLLRYGVLSPLSLIIPPLRRIVIERYSSLSINPAFRRRMPEGDFRKLWLRTETATSIWAMTLIALTATGIIPLRAFLIYMGVLSGVAVLNQVRTLVAHLWENDGEQMSVTEQYLDSTNVPPPATLPMLWAPVGLRYHALHHLLPGLPYHSLAEAHRRLSRELDTESAYHRASHRGLPVLLNRLIRSTMGMRAGR